MMSIEYRDFSSKRGALLCLVKQKNKWQNDIPQKNKDEEKGGS